MTLYKATPAFVFIAAAAFGLALSGCQTTGHDHSGHSHDHAGHAHTQTTGKHDTSPSKPAAEEKLCPVSGEVIEKAYVVEYQGRKVELCCKSCAKDFLANPTAYLDGDAS